MRNLNIHGMIITIKNIMRNLNIHGMIITILDQQFNQVSVPIVIVTILLNSLSPGNADVFPVVSANPPSAPYFSVACFRRSNYGVWREFREEGEIGRGGYEVNLGCFSCSRLLGSLHDLNAVDNLHFSALFRRSDRFYTHFCKSYVWVGAPEKGLSSLFFISKRALTYILMS